MTVRKFLVGLAVPVLLSAVDVQAQANQPASQPPPDEVPRGATVADRPRPDYDPLGVRLGGFLLYPALSVEEIYNSNVFATQTNERDDFITEIQPSLDLRSNWNNHALNLRADSRVVRFADISSEDVEDYTLAANGRLDVLRDLRVLGGAGYRVRHESRSSPDDQGGAEPAEYSVADAALGVEKDFNRLSLRLDGELERYRFDDVATNAGGIIDQSDRDRDHTTLSMRAGYELAPLREVYLLGSYNWRDYESATDRNGFNRDSDGYMMAVGAEYDLTGVTFLDGYIGYREQNYDDSRLRKLDGWAAGLKLTWNVTRLTTVTGSLSRTIQETTRNGSSGYFATVASIRADHELLRNLLLNASIGMEEDDFQGISRQDDYLLFSAGARYLMNRYLSVSGGYGYRTRDSNVQNVDFDENVVFLRLTGHL